MSRIEAILSSVEAIVLLVFGVAGTLGVVFGLLWGIVSLRFASGALETQGIVIQIVEVKGKRSDSIRTAPVVRYQVNGRTCEVKGTMLPSPPDAYSIGGAVKVLYKPDNPCDGRIASFDELWAIPLLFGGGGSVIAYLAFRNYFARQKSSGTNPRH
jgi:hypothetical protein